MGRTRAIRMVLIPALVLLLVVVIGVAARPLAAFLAPAAPTASSTFGLPDKIQVPVWAESATADPFGRASVAFGGPGDGFVGLSEYSRIAVVGPTSYRRTGHWWDSDSVHIGEEVLLSPDGTQLALVQESLRIVDFSTGRSRYLQLPFMGRRWTWTEDSRHFADVLAWSPDGRSLAIVEGINSYPVRWKALGIIDVQSGAYRRLAPGDGELVRGFAAAFSPDSQRIAYQSGDRISIVDVNANAISSASLPPGALLAGKGAWTPDGSSIAVTVPQQCCTPLATDWTIRYFAADTGEAASGPTFSTITDAMAVRFLGWATPSRAVIVAFRPGNQDPGYIYSADRTFVWNLRRLDILAIEPGRQASRIIDTPSDVLAIDIADEAITSGVTVPAPPRPIMPSRDFLARTILAAAIVSLVLTTATFVIIQLVRRRMRSNRILDNQPV